MSEPSVPPTNRGGREPTDDRLDQRILEEHWSIPAETRKTVLERDTHRCRIDGRRRSSDEDSPQLVVQRLQKLPCDCQPNAPENLTTCCMRCARWIRQMPTRDDLPSAIRKRLDGADLDADRIKMLRHIYDNGPARTGELTDVVDRANPTSVRRALYSLMKLDVCDDAVEDRLVAKDRLAGVYGLPWQIPDDRQARGIIPLKPHVRRTRILDAVTDRLIETLDGRVDNPREIAAEVVDREPNQTYNMQTRAKAFQFPFEEWAATDRARYDEAAAVEAVTILAAATDNVSRRRIAEPLVEVLEHNDDHELATVVRDALLEDGQSFEVFAGQSTESAADTAEQSDTDPGGAAADASSTGVTLRTFDDDTTATRPPEASEHRDDVTTDDIAHQ